MQIEIVLDNKEFLVVTEDGNVIERGGNNFAHAVVTGADGIPRTVQRAHRSISFTPDGSWRITGFESAINNRRVPWDLKSWVDFIATCKQELFVSGCARISPLSNETLRCKNGSLKLVLTDIDHGTHRIQGNRVAYIYAYGNTVRI